MKNVVLDELSIMRNPKTLFLTYFTHPHTIAYQTHNHIQLYNTYARTKRSSFSAIKTRATRTSLLAWSHRIHFIISPRSAASRLRGLTTTATPSNKACCYAGAIRITRVRKIWFLRFVMSVTRVMIVTIVSHIGYSGTLRVLTLVTIVTKSSSPR